MDIGRSFPQNRHQQVREKSHVSFRNGGFTHSEFQHQRQDLEHVGNEFLNVLKQNFLNNQINRLHFIHKIYKLSKTNLEGRKESIFKG